MNRVKIWAGIIAVFLSGAVIGFVLGSTYVENRIHSEIKRLSSGEMRPINEIILERLSQNLGLNKSQQGRILPILDAGFQKIMELRRDNEPKMEKIREDSFARIREVLSEKQQGKFDALIKAGEFFPRPPFPPPPPGAMGEGPPPLGFPGDLPPPPGFPEMDGARPGPPRPLDFKGKPGDPQKGMDKAAPESRPAKP